MSTRGKLKCRSFPKGTYLGSERPGFECRALGVTVQEPSAVRVSHSQLHPASALVIGRMAQFPWGLSIQLRASQELGAQYKLFPFCYPHPFLWMFGCIEHIPPPFLD